MWYRARQSDLDTVKPGGVVRLDRINMKDRIDQEMEEAGIFQEFGKADLPPHPLLDHHYQKGFKDGARTTEDKLIDLVTYLTEQLVQARSAPKEEVQQEAIKIKKFVYESDRVGDAVDPCEYIPKLERAVSSLVNMLPSQNDDVRDLYVDLGWL